MQFDFFFANDYLLVKQIQNQLDPDSENLKTMINDDQIR